MKLNYNAFFVSSIFFLLPVFLFADEALVVDSSAIKPANMSSVMIESVVKYTPPADGFAGRSGDRVIVRVVNSCFGANLRSIQNPVSPDGIITANLTVKKGTELVTLSADYPGETVGEEGSSVGQSYTVPNDATKAPVGTQVLLYGNIIEFSIPSTAFKDTNSELSILMSDFSQKVASCGGKKGNLEPVYKLLDYPVDNPTYPCGQYMGQDGPLSVRLGGATVSPDQKQIEISASFPGQTGFCGGYWSPLMIFADDDRPTFNNISEFPLNPLGKTYWPEAKSKGYWVAIDKDKSGTIDNRDELFGESFKYTNGFEAIKVLDTNKDAFLDAKDIAFSKLLLWNDVNGNGKSEKSELVKLSKLIKKVDLNYNAGYVRPLGRHAQERGKSVVYTVNNKKWDIVDIWLDWAKPKSENVLSKK